MHQIVLESGTGVKEVNFIRIEPKGVQGFGIVPIMVANGRGRLLEIFVLQSSGVIEI